LDTSNQRPDLLAPVRGAADSGTRILASLEHGNRLPGKLSQATRWHLDGWTAGMGAAVLVMAALAWVSREAAINSGPSRALAGGQRASAARTATATRAATPATSITTPRLQESTAATIVSLPEPAAPALHAGQSAVPASAQPGQPKLTATAGASGSGAPLPLPAQRAAAVARPVPSTAPRSVASAAVTASHDTGAAHPATTPSDTDVALLTALVAHAGAPTTVTPERSRDVVLVQEGESTTLLLVRCKQLGLIEGMLCRSRICSGRWENDPACRAPYH